MRISSFLFFLTAAAGLSSCSTQQLYGVGQEWKRNECNKVIDMQERNLCMSSTKTSYEDYKRQSEAARDSK